MSTATASNVDWFANRFERIANNIEKAIQGKRQPIEHISALPGRGRSPPVGGRSRGWQDVAGKVAGQVDRLLLAAGFSSRRTFCPRDVTGVNDLEQQPPEPSCSSPEPIFANIVLGDEINRALPKTQAPCWSAMEERQVTVDGVPPCPSRSWSRHPEPDRARGHLSPSRSTTGPVHDAAGDWLPQP